MQRAKRRAETSEDAPRKRHQPIPPANTTAVIAIEDHVGNDRNHQVIGRSRSTGPSFSSSSDSSSDTSSDGTSSHSESTSGSSSDPNSDSYSSSSSSSDDSPRILRPLPSSAPQRKPPQPTYVTLSLLEKSSDLGSSPQAYPSTARIWEATDPLAK